MSATEPLTSFQQHYIFLLLFLKRSVQNIAAQLKLHAGWRSVHVCRYLGFSRCLFYFFVYLHCRLLSVLTNRNKSGSRTSTTIADIFTASAQRINTLTNYTRKSQKTEIVITLQFLAGGQVSILNLHEYIHADGMLLGSGGSGG